MARLGALSLVLLAGALSTMTMTAASAPNVGFVSTEIEQVEHVGARDSGQPWDSAPTSEDRVPEEQLEVDEHLRSLAPALSVAESECRGDGILTGRDYLNDLVDKSAADKENQLANIAFVKTHKTASTTLAAVLYRYAVRHNLKLAHFGNTTSVSLKTVADKVRRSHEPVDVFHYHITPTGQNKGTWNGAYLSFRTIMREPDTINFVTILREPRSHLLSYYYYYIQPKNQLSIEEFLSESSNFGDADHQRLKNPLAAEFGTKSEWRVRQFIEKVLPTFRLVIMTDRLDEGLLVLRHLMGWHLIDVTYMTLNETKEGQRRWDGKPFVDRPDFDDLSKEVQDKIDELTKLDRMLYRAGQEEFEKRFATVSDRVEDDLPAFRELQATIRDYLKANDSSGARPMYRQMDVYKAPPAMKPF
ncbi:unnamed protein product [Ascophyllum nodosum]